MPKKKSLKKANGKRSGAKKSSLYSSPDHYPTQFAPRFYSINPEPTEVIAPRERLQQIILGRELFAKMPLVAASIMNKNKLCVGNAWQPVFDGEIRNEKDSQWVDKVYEWLSEDFYKNLNWNGANFSFNDTLFLTGKDIDVDGGSLMVFRTTKAGLPRIQLVPTDRIGSRGNETVIEGGKYNGKRIFDGVIYTDENMPIAYKILGATIDDDQIVSAFNCQYIYEPAWTAAGHGISRVAYSVTNLMDIQDINEMLKVTIKNFSSQGIIHSNSKGAAPKGKRVFGKETPAVEGEVSPQGKIFVENVNRGGTHYISSLDGSEIKPFDFNRPSPNTEGFIRRITSEAIVSMGWFMEMVSPEGLSGPSTRAVQDQARKLVVDRQQTLERRAKAILQYGIATAIENGVLPKTNNPTWLKWKFNMPSELTVDSGYDNAAQIESLKYGLSTKAEICSRKGKDWYSVTNQQEVELRDLFTRAQALAKEFNMTEGEAREWLRNSNIQAIAQPAPEEIKKAA